MARYRTNPHNVDAIQVLDVAAKQNLLDNLDDGFNEWPKWFLLAVAKQLIVPFKGGDNKAWWRVKLLGGDQVAGPLDWIISDPISGIEVAKAADFPNLYTPNP